MQFSIFLVLVALLVWIFVGVWDFIAPELTRKNWLKASPFEGEIKIRVFITPILFLLGRGRSQTVNCQLSTVNC